MKTAGITAVIVGVFMAGTAVCAEETNSFKTTLSAGTTLAKGNSEAFQVNGTLVTEGEKKEFGSMRAGAEANYGRSTVADVESTTLNNSRIFANGKRTLSDAMFAYIDGSAFRDRVAKVEHRINLGPGFGAYFVKNDKTSLSAEVGPSYVWESTGDVNLDRWVIRVGQRFAHALSESAKVWQSAEYLPEEEDFENYLINAEIGAEAALNAHLNLRLVLQDKYSSRPAEGFKNNDLTVIAGLSVKL